jgi:hypothetical protein
MLVNNICGSGFLEAANQNLLGSAGGMVLKGSLTLLHSVWARLAVLHCPVRGPP